VVPATKLFGRNIKVIGDGEHCVPATHTIARGVAREDRAFCFAGSVFAGGDGNNEFGFRSDFAGLESVYLGDGARRGLILVCDGSECLALSNFVVTPPNSFIYWDGGNGLLEFGSRTQRQIQA